MTGERRTWYIESMDATQVLIMVVILALTIMMVVIGVQVVFILQEIRKSLSKGNKMLDDVSMVSGSISKTVSEATGVVDGIKAGLSLVSLFHHKKE